MRPHLLLVLGGVVAACTVSARALDLDVTLQDIERALTIARSTDGERARFHAPYLRTVNTPFVETAEVVSEYRRVVLLAEERVRKGDRGFAYSMTMAQKAVAPWKGRVSVVARMRFHPMNTYIGVPDAVEITLPQRPSARIGVLKEPIFGFQTPSPGDRQTVMGAMVEGVFDAAALGDGTYEFVIRFENKDVARVAFDLAALQ